MPYYITLYFGPRCRLVLGGPHTRMLRNKEGYQFDCDKLLHREVGGQNDSIFLYILFEDPLCHYSKLSLLLVN